MSKAVLISIKPEWCELIESGKKTIEVRKTKPKLETLFKCYIYCTKGNVDSSFYCGLDGIKNGKVIGEFVCDKITELAPINRSPDDVEERACLTRREIVRYLKGRGYAWHISDLVIYNKPKELREFYSKCDKDCPNCEYGGYDIVNAEEFDMHCASGFYGHKTLKRPPQSWCYVEEV